MGHGPFPTDPCMLLLRYGHAAVQICLCLCYRVLSNNDVTTGAAAIAITLMIRSAVPQHTGHHLKVHFVCVQCIVCKRSCDAVKNCLV